MTSLALVIPISTFVGYGMGYGIDHLLGTSWIRFLFLGLGAVAGFVSLVREVGKDDSPQK